MADLLDCALLAANVYGNKPNPPDIVRSVNNTLPVPEGWTPLLNPTTGGWTWANQNNPRSGVTANYGFMARAYTNGSEIVISYAGTTDEASVGWAKR
jgi:hypothetical protein